MNKKFIKASLIICISLLLLIGFFAITTNNISNSDEMENDILITYNKYIEDKYSYTIYVTVKIIQIK